MKTEAPTSEREQFEFELEIEAAQAGHSVRTEQRIYAVSMTTMTNASDAKVFGFCVASCKWQVIVGVTPGGLGFSFSEARYTNFDNLKASGKLAEYVLSAPSPALSTSAPAIDLQSVVSSITAALEPKFASLHQKIDALAIKSEAIAEEVRELKSASHKVAHSFASSPVNLFMPSSPKNLDQEMIIDSPPHPSHAPVASTSSSTIIHHHPHPPMIMQDVDLRKRALSNADEQTTEQKRTRVEAMPSMATGEVF